MADIVVRRNPGRALTTWESFYRPMSLLDDIERFASDMWESWTPMVYGNPGYALDMYGNDDELVMRAELPGIGKEDITVDLENGELTIKANKKQPEMPEGVTYYTSERCFGEYSRTVSLPFPVDAEKVSATFENGLLEIKLPKAEEAKAKHIEVKVK